MQLGLVGLGRMGANIAQRLMRAGHQTVVYDRDPAATAAVVAHGAQGVTGLAAMVDALAAPRAVWVMLPAGEATEDAVTALGGRLGAGDTVLDGGNSWWRDAVRRSQSLAAHGVHFLDVGTSGGVWGLERGYCLMIGGDAAAVKSLDPIFRDLAPGLGPIPRTDRPSTADPRAELGYIHAGPAGAGHFVKMIHNGIEYGLMQAYAEGFAILQGRAAPDLPPGERFDLRLDEIAEVWRRGSVVSSWLLDLAAQALARDPALGGFDGVVADSGEGRWTVEAAIEEAVPATVLSASLFARFRSREKAGFADRLLSALRLGFGGHREPPA